MRVENLAGRLLFIGFEGHTLASAPHVVDHAREGRIGGVLLLGRNCHTRDQLIQLCDEIHNLPSPHPLFIALDQEGGHVRRIHWREAPSARDVAATMTPGQAEELYEAMAHELREVGVDWNLAPVVDLDIEVMSPAIGMFGRSFGRQPVEVASYAASFVRAHRRHGVTTCLKHFPGHGSATVDTHEGLADITTTWRHEELAPYRALLAGGLVDAVMTGHLLDSRIDILWPATLSYPHLQHLREELGWHGAVVSDDIQMGALHHLGSPEQLTLRALMVGVDICVTGNWLQRDPQFAARWRDTALRAVDNDILSVERLQGAVERLDAIFSCRTPA